MSRMVNSNRLIGNVLIEFICFFNLPWQKKLSEPKCPHFHAVFGKKWPNSMLASPPPPREILDPPLYFTRLQMSIGIFLLDIIVSSEKEGKLMFETVIQSFTT